MPLVFGQTVLDFRDLLDGQLTLIDRKFEEEIEALGEKYVASLQQLEEGIRAEGDLTTVLLLRKTIESFNANQPQSVEGALAENPAYMRLQGVWNSLFTQWDVRRSQSKLEVISRYDAMLEKQQTQATKEGEIDLAISIRDERNRLEESEEVARMRALVKEATPEVADPGFVPGQSPLLSSYAQNMVLHYAFDRNQGDRVSDRGRYRKDGKGEALEWVANGKKGGAIRFNGNDAYIRVPNDKDLQITGPLTLSFWIFPEKFEARRNPINKAYGGEFTLTLEIEGNINFYYGTAGRDEPPYQGFGSSSKMPLKEWTHLCLVRDPDQKQLTWYMDGKKVSEAEMKYEEAKASGAPLTLGKGYAGAFLGMLDEVIILNKALDDRDVQRLYQSMGGR
jgi:hypothetical protein